MGDMVAVLEVEVVLEVNMVVVMAEVMEVHTAVLMELI